MFRGIALTNFQGFRGEQTAHFAPITLIFGPNSAGKSSIGRALRLLKQSENGFKYSGDEVKLGSHNNVLFGQTSDPDAKEVAVAVLTDLHDNLLPSAIAINRVTEWIGIAYEEFKVKTGLIGTENGNPFEFHIECPSEGQDYDSLGEDSLESWLDPKMNDLVIAFLKSKEAREMKFGDSWTDTPLGAIIHTSHFEAIQNQVRYLGSDEFDYDSPIDISSAAKFWVWGHVLEAIAESIDSHLAGLTHVPGLRNIPTRIEVANEVRAPQTFEKLNTWLRRLTSDRYEVRSQVVDLSDAIGPVSVTSTYFEDLYTGASVSFEDLGSGIGQVFPILNALFAKPVGKFPRSVFIEQPELHLHPSMQAALADAFIDACKSQQVFVETHSEAILLRLQKRIRDGALNPKDVTIVFVEPSPTNNEFPNSSRFNMMRNIGFRDDGELEDPNALQFAGLRLVDLMD